MFIHSLTPSKVSAFEEKIKFEKDLLSKITDIEKFPSS